MIIPKGRLISVKRIEKGFSMRELARQAELNIGTISQIESKSKATAPKTAKKICDVLGVSFYDLFDIQDQV
ncbi:MAG: helix-turn-helix domain-containing protein [Eubacteriales bacterium]